MNQGTLPPRGQQYPEKHILTSELVQVSCELLYLEQRLLQIADVAVLTSPYDLHNHPTATSA